MVRPDESFPESHVMAAYLDGMGVASPRVLQEDSSSNTAENLAFSLELLTSHLGARPQRIAIATDGFHQLRASVYAAQLGVESVSLSASTPCGLVPSYWVREWIGLAAIAVGLR